MNDLGSGNGLSIWITVNSAALIGLVFHAGQVFNRLKNVEDDVLSLKARDATIALLSTAVAVLTAQISEMGRKLDHLTNALEDTRSRPNITS